MESPYKGRAILQDNGIEQQIVIPAKRNWFLVFFIGAWLCGWLMGELFAIASVTGLLGRNPAAPFIMFWLIAWTVGGFFAFRVFLWNITGKEMITVGQGRIAIEKKGALLFKPKVYDLNEVKNIRVQEENSEYGGFYGSRRNALGIFNSGGTIRFDYGLQTVKFAGGIDEAEAKFILGKLKDRHLITERNYL